MTHKLLDLMEVTCTIGLNSSSYAEYTTGWSLHSNPQRWKAARNTLVEVHRKNHTEIRPLQGTTTETWSREAHRMDRAIAVLRTGNHPACALLSDKVQRCQRAQSGKRKITSLSLGTTQKQSNRHYPKSKHLSRAPSYNKWCGQSFRTLQSKMLVQTDAPEGKQPPRGAAPLIWTTRLVFP